MKKYVYKFEVQDGSLSIEEGNVEASNLKEAYKLLRDFSHAEGLVWKNLNVNLVSRTDRRTGERRDFFYR